MTILIVDDSKTMRMLVMRALKQAGFDNHKMVTASNGAEALEVIAAHCPDVILSDWNMPVMDGLQLLKTIRKQGNITKFGFITTEGTDDVRQLATDAGASFFIEKPFTAENIDTVLRPVLR